MVLRADWRRGSVWTSWCLARLGARQPFYGSTHLVIPIEDAERWVNRFLIRLVSQDSYRFRRCEPRTLDRRRSRDLSQSLREESRVVLEKTQRAQSLAACVLEIVELSEQDEKQLRGDSLPQGLIGDHMMRFLTLTLIVLWASTVSAQSHWSTYGLYERWVSDEAPAHVALALNYDTWLGQLGSTSDTIPRPSESVSRASG